MSSKPEVVDLTDGEDLDFDDIAEEIEFMTADMQAPSTSGQTNNRRYRAPQGPRGPPPYPEYERDILEPPGNFWRNRKDHYGSDVPPMDETNPLIDLEFYLPELAKFIGSQGGLLQNINLVAQRIYNLGANRPCTDPFCQYGRATKPVVLSPKEVEIHEVLTPTTNAGTSTPKYQDITRGEVQF